MIEQFQDERLSDPRILAFIPRIRIAADEKLDALGNEYRYATRLEVVTASGTVHARETLYRPGSPDAPLTPAQVRDKFERLARSAVDPESVARIAAEIATLDTRDSIRPLAAMLARDTHAAAR